MSWWTICAISLVLVFMVFVLPVMIMGYALGGVIGSVSKSKDEAR
jgi:hypothetical protein